MNLIEAQEEEKVIYSTNFNIFIQNIEDAYIRVIWKKLISNT